MAQLEPMTQLELFAADAPHAPPDLPPDARWRSVATPHGRIDFVLRRSRRKSIGLAIDEHGLTITAPHWTTLGQIDTAVTARARWVLQKLAQQRQRRNMLTADANLWQHQSRVAYLGRNIRLSLGAERDRTTFDGDLFQPRDDDVLWLPLPCDANPSRVRDTVHAWLQQQAHVWFDQRLQYFLAQSQQRIRRWRLSSATTRWGSCSSNGTIMLNWRLIQFSHNIIDYVIAHEIAHLREMNHSQAFWHEVGRILPGFEASRQALKQIDARGLRG